VPRQPQAVVPFLDPTDFGSSSTFANLFLIYEGVLADVRLNQQPDIAISCRMCQKIFTEQSKLRYVAVFTCLVSLIEGSYVDC
jgi:hypothetical protein